MQSAKGLCWCSPFHPHEHLLSRMQELLSDKANVHCLCSPCKPVGYATELWVQEMCCREVKCRRSLFSILSFKLINFNDPLGVNAAAPLWIYPERPNLKSQSEVASPLLYQKYSKLGPMSEFIMLLYITCRTAWVIFIGLRGIVHLSDNFCKKLIHHCFTFSRSLHKRTTPFFGQGSAFT